jgi:hypothetical protein
MHLFKFYILGKQNRLIAYKIVRFCALRNRIVFDRLSSMEKSGIYFILKATTGAIHFFYSIIHQYCSEWDHDTIRAAQS